MLRTALPVVGVIGTLLATTIAASHNRSSNTAVVTHEIIAVYVGTAGTDTSSGMVDVVRDMRYALQRQASANAERFIARGVSLEPTVDGGLRHLARFGRFDEVSVGGNWTNSAVVRYLGPDMGDHQRASIPQVVLLEREVREDGPSALVVGPEREIGRYMGGEQIRAWVHRGSPLTR